MSDEWYFFPCQIGDQSGSIFYDHGIRETIDQLAPPHLLKVRVTLQAPRADGLSSSEEYERLCALEDDIQALARANGGLYVGRITVGGHRTLHIFTADPGHEWDARLAAVGARHGYALHFALAPDPERAGYWQDLFPTDDDWQVIQDLRVLQSLENHGDDASIVRPIDHWAHFAADAGAREFAAWAADRGYHVSSVEPTQDGTLCVRLSHTGTVQLSAISSHTIALRRKAAELAGDYDGWETPVCKSAT